MVAQMSGNKACHPFFKPSDIHFLTVSDFPLVAAERFEEDNDPEACLDEFSSENHGYEETETSSQGNEVLYTNYTPNSEFPTPLYTHNYLSDFICRRSIDHCRILESGTRNLKTA